MNQDEGPDAQERGPKFQFSIRSLLIGVSLVAAAILNVTVFQHSQLLEYQYRRSLTETRPWIWPEGASGLFMLVWGLGVIACATIAFRTRDKHIKYEAMFFAALALIAVVSNAWFGLLEAFQF